MRLVDHTTDLNTEEAAIQPVVRAPELEWTDNLTPVSTVFADPYYAREDGRAEARDVFVRGNGLPERWADKSSFSIGELGFGTGLNFLETWRLWTEVAPRNARLNFISFELWPLEAEQIATAISPWPDLAEPRASLLANWHISLGAQRVLDTNGVTLTVVVGDARTELARWNGVVDAWYLDGFSPASNPELWEAGLMRDVFERTAPGGTFSTYTSAGWVRRNLVAAGFEVAKVPGHGRKRERLQGRRSE